MKLDIKKNYNKIYKKRDQVVYKKIMLPYKYWRNKYLLINNGNVLDYGSNINSEFYRLVKSQNCNYYGYDVDQDTVGWLKINKYYIDFYKTTKSFSHINASQVYEHLSIEERIKFLDKCYLALDDNGILTIDFPFIENLNITGFYRDLTHYPVSSLDDPLLMINAGFTIKNAYLIGWPSLFNPFPFIFNYLLFGNWQTNVQLVLEKK